MYSPRQQVNFCLIAMLRDALSVVITAHAVINATIATHAVRKCSRIARSALFNKYDETALELRDTDDGFIDLPALPTSLENWRTPAKDHWRPQVINFARNFVKED